MIIYKATINNKVYIGKTKKSLNIRVKRHIYDSKIPKTSFHRAINKYGSENVFFEIIYECISEEDMNNKEVFYINLFKSNNNEFGYNITSGGDGGDTISNNPNLNKIVEKRLKTLGKEYKHISNKLKREIISDYNNGLAIRQLSRKYLLHRNRIKRLLIKNNINIDSNSGKNKLTIITNEQSEIIESLFSKNILIKNISNELNLSEMIVSRYLHDRGLRISKRFKDKRY